LMNENGRFGARLALWATSKILTLIFTGDFVG
jgi:hypothetical protein